MALSHSFLWLLFRCVYIHLFCPLICGQTLRSFPCLATVNSTAMNRGAQIFLNLFCLDMCPGLGLLDHMTFLCPALPLSLSLSGHRAAAFLLFAISSYSHPLRFAEKHRSQDRFPYPFSSPTPSLVFPGGGTFWSCMEPCGCDFWGTGVGVPSCIARKEMLNSPRWTLEKEACRKSPPPPPPLFHCLQGGPGDLEDGLERELQKQAQVSPLPICLDLCDLGQRTPPV